MKMIKSFHDLDVWRKAHSLTVMIYQVTKDFPDEERYGITSQIRRAFVSIPTNICEGTGRYSTKELLYFLNISRGSLEESKYLMILVKDLEYVDNKIWTEISAELNLIGKMLNGLINSLRLRIKKNQPPDTNH